MTMTLIWERPSGLWEPEKSREPGMDGGEVTGTVFGEPGAAPGQ